MKDDGSKLMKTCFVAYSPDDCRVMASKFAMQNYKDSVKSKINCQREIQINDINDFSEANFRDAFGL